MNTILSNDEPFSPHYSTHIPTNLNSEELLRQKSKKTGQGIRPKTYFVGENIIMMAWNPKEREREREERGKKERMRKERKKRGREYLSSFMPDMNSSFSWYFHH